MAMHSRARKRITGMSAEPRIAAIVPCHNEEAAIAQVVTDLRTVAPAIDVYVYDDSFHFLSYPVWNGPSPAVTALPTNTAPRVVRRARYDKPVAAITPE